MSSARAVTGTLLWLRDREARLRAKYKIRLTQIRNQKWKIESLEQQLSTLREKYNELLYGVENKFPEETRHETALRYILERERQPSQAAAQALADTGESDNQGPEGVMSPSP